MVRKIYSSTHTPTVASVKFHSEAVFLLGFFSFFLFSFSLLLTFIWPRRPPVLAYMKMKIMWWKLLLNRCNYPIAWLLPRWTWNYHPSKAGPVRFTSWHLIFLFYVKTLSKFHWQIFSNVGTNLQVKLTSFKLTQSSEKSGLVLSVARKIQRKKKPFWSDLELKRKLRHIYTGPHCQFFSIIRSSR